MQLSNDDGSTCSQIPRSLRLMKVSLAVSFKLLKDMPKVLIAFVELQNGPGK